MHLSFSASIDVSSRRWHGVAVWKWDVNEDVCGICRLAFDACCPDCTVPGDNCSPVWGQCNHTFHMHCVLKHLQFATQQNRPQQCPLCRQEWQFREAQPATAEEDD
ncbi:Putative subunit of the Anaphase Promoting Complex [Ectocarpus siliculosus]|uniref:Anaphase-promoting complex subunit 11 n=1 Tax=Ectocarpus siliculosus TaxID=2880 RepID=D7FXF9_ECTSI|nr:Putative subunit of the Anaphase Promoting Complex [Ectocarpus siliculosus]|eukprot:CBJ32296.1 Putative subunit of the Anaphase Promoting Complex [Ectocarpus siliculosus]